MQDNIIKYFGIEPYNASRKKTIVMFHGWGSTTVSQIELGEELSKLGFEIKIPEIIYHDTRQALSNHFDKKVIESHFWKTIFESMEEESKLINDLKLEKENTILFGSSMGGFIASGIFFSNPGYAGLINLNGSSSFLASENNFRKRDKREALNTDELLRFKEHDPKYKRVLINRPILFLHGEMDDVIPIDGQNDFIKSSNEKYLSFLKYKEVNHTFTTSMKNDLLNWINKSFEPF